MKVAILSNPSPANRHRGIGKYTEILFNTLSNYDKQDYYYEIEDVSRLKDNTDILIIPDFSFFRFSLPLNSRAKHTIVVIHDIVPFLYPSHFPSGIRGNMIWQLQKILLENSIDWIITDSNTSKNDIVRFLPKVKDKISVIYPIVSDNFKILSDNRILSKTRQKYNLPKQFVLYVGDANWNKNLVNLIKSAKTEKYELVIAGKVFTDSSVDLLHPWNKSLKEVKALAKGVDNIHFLGYVSDRNLVCLYNLASVYVQPSLYEGFGLPVLEALLTGCPVVCSDIGSLREIGSDCVLYFHPNNIDDLTQKINLLTQNEKLRIRNSQKGLHQAKKFTIDQFVKSFHSICERLKANNAY